MGDTFAVREKSASVCKMEEMMLWNYWAKQEEWPCVEGNAYRSAWTADKLADGHEYSRYSMDAGKTWNWFCENIGKQKKRSVGNQKQRI